MKIKAFAKQAKKTVLKHSPTILTFIGVTGLVGTAVLVGKATPKALKLIDAKIEEKNKKIREEATINGEKECEQITSLRPLETVKVAWKPYAPAVTVGVLSATCIIGANSVNLRRQAALVAAYTLSETALGEYKQQVIETLGEKKEQLIHDKVMEEKIQKNPPPANHELAIEDDGNQLCYDAVSGRYFRSNMETIRRIVSELNKRMFMHNYISLNEFYYEIGLDNVKIGNDLGWNSIDEQDISVRFSSHITKNGKTCLVIDYDYAPRWDYRNLL